MKRLSAVSIFEAPAYSKVAAVILGAVLMGTMWRIRGDVSFGGFWGMLAVGVAFVLYIFALCGTGTKTRAEYFAFTALMFAVTNGGWGTLNSQITGKLNSSVEFSDGYMHVISVEPWSAVIIMLLLGFSWAPFLGALLGVYFSPQKYTFKSFAGIIVFFYVMQNAFKLTVAHPLFKLINPKAVTMFADGLKDKAIVQTPWKVYLQNYFDASFAKTIPGGRNYFTSIAVISGALAALALVLFLWFYFEDKRAARFMFLSCTAFAVGITVADFFILWQHGATWSSIAPHESFEGWRFWEYFTGFISGLLLMLLIFSEGRGRVRASAQMRIISSESLPQPIPMMIQLFLAFLLPFGASITVPLASGIDELLKGSQFFVILIGALLFLIVGIYLVYRNMYQKEQSEIYAAPFSRTATFILPGYFLAVNFIYWFTGNAFALNPPISDINILMLTSFGAFILLYYAAFGDLLKKEWLHAKVSK